MTTEGDTAALLVQQPEPSIPSSISSAIMGDNTIRYVIIVIAVVLVILIVYQIYNKKKEGYNKNRPERDDPQGDWSVEDRVRQILAKQETNLIN